MFSLLVYYLPCTAINAMSTPVATLVMIGAILGDAVTIPLAVCVIVRLFRRQEGYVSNGSPAERHNRQRRIQARKRERMAMMLFERAVGRTQITAELNRQAEPCRIVK
jgi:hypothetical protein